MTGNSEKFNSENKRARDQFRESLASITLPCVQSNSAQFSDIQRESERDSEHSQTLKESPASFNKVLESSGIKMRFPFFTKTGEAIPFRVQLRKTKDRKSQKKRLKTTILEI